MIMNPTFETLESRRGTSPTMTLTTIILLLKPFFTFTIRNDIMLFPILITHSLITNTLVMRGSSTIIFIIDTTFVIQHRELEDFRIPNKLLKLWAKSILKLNALEHFSSYPILVRDKPRQFLKLYSIICNSRIPLLKFKEFNLFLAMHISFELFLQEFSLKNSPSDHCTISLKSSIIPPVLYFFR